MVCMERRRALRLAGVGAVTVLAGCSGDGGNGNGDGNESDGGGNSTTTPAGNDTTTGTDSPTATDEATAVETEPESPTATQEASEPEGSASSQADGLRITSHEIYPVESGDNEGLANIDGVVVNERDSSVDYVEVVGRTYGEYEDEYYASTEDLEAGGEWEFTVEMSSYYEDVEEYEVVVSDEPIFGSG